MPEVAAIIPKSYGFALKFLALILCAYFGICALLFVAQRKLIYLPSRANAILPSGFEPWVSVNTRGETELWGFKRTNGSHECLFFFHGNGGNASGWSYAVEHFPGDIYVMEYPGYGERSGSPTELSIKTAALAAFESDHQKYQKIILCGQSLGTGVTQAIFTKHAEKLHALVLITPFLSLAEVAGVHFPWAPARWLVRDRLPLYESYLNFPGRSLAVLASDDEVIPRTHNLRYLASTNQNRRVIELPSTSHNTIDLDRSFWARILDGEHWAQP